MTFFSFFMWQKKILIWIIIRNYRKITIEFLLLSDFSHIDRPKLQQSKSIKLLLVVLNILKPAAFFSPPSTSPDNNTFKSWEYVMIPIYRQRFPTIPTEAFVFLSSLRGDITHKSRYILFHCPAIYTFFSLSFSFLVFNSYNDTRRCRWSIWK